MLSNTRHDSVSMTRFNFQTSRLTIIVNWLSYVQVTWFFVCKVVVKHGIIISHISISLNTWFKAFPINWFYTLICESKLSLFIHIGILSNRKLLLCSLLLRSKWVSGLLLFFNLLSWILCTFLVSTCNITFCNIVHWSITTYWWTTAAAVTAPSSRHNWVAWNVTWYFLLEVEMLHIHLFLFNLI